MQDFTGRVAVVTGAGSGMGRAFAERFAREGMRVVLADVEEPALEAAVAALRQAEHDVIGVPTDVSSRDAVRELADRTLDAYGGVHLVCNNAGVEGYLEGAIWEATPRDWEWTFGVNAWGVIHGVETFLPIMLEQGEPGHIVNTVSMTAMVRATNMYGVTKHAMLAYSEVIFAQLKERGAPIGISALCPGMIATRIFDGVRNRPAALRNDPDPERDRVGAEARQGMRERQRDAMPPEEVADILLQAIRDEQFYVLTDQEWDPLIVDRHENVMARRNPDPSVRFRRTAR